MKDNKWICGAIPALLIHICIGSVYCWSLLKDSVALEMGVGVGSVEFAFTLAIFFLGMSAAFGGNFVEHDVRKASILSMLCFSLGLIGSVISIYSKNVFGFYLNYGVLMGIGLGIGYLSPVKTLMLWFKDNKGLATGLAIMGFGLSKSLFSPYIEWCTKEFSIYGTLLSMSIISMTFMSIASTLIKKPIGWIESNKKISIKDALNIILTPTYIKIWIIFFLNITCGLVVISFEKGISLEYGVGLSFIGMVASVSAIFNALGRFGYATLSDHFNKKVKIYNIIFLSCILGITIFMIGSNTLLWLILLMIINLGYGGGFSTLPNLLAEKFGMNNISTIHGFCLSAWGFAAVAAFILTQIFIYNLEYTFNQILAILGFLYSIALGISLTIRK